MSPAPPWQVNLGLCTRVLPQGVAMPDRRAENPAAPQGIPAGGCARLSGGGNHRPEQPDWGESYDVENALHLCWHLPALLHILCVPAWAFIPDVLHPARTFSSGAPRAKTISWGRIHGFRSCSMPVLPFLPALGGNWAFVFRRIQRLSPEKDRLAFPRPPVFQQRSRGKKRSGSPSSRTRIGLPEYGKKSAAWRHMKVPAGRDLRRFARFAPPAASNAGRADSTSRMRET